MELERELAIAKQAARAAGEKILEVYYSNNLDVTIKDGDQPVTRADKAANDCLCLILHKAFPDYGILTEEIVETPSLSLQAALDEWRERRHAWIIDPLDGTKDFIKRNGEFGVHIGLTCDGEPVLGVNYYPTMDGLFYYAIKGQGAYKEFAGGIAREKPERIHVSSISVFESMRIAVSTATHNDQLRAFLDGTKFKEVVTLGSLGLKLCKVAEGFIDVYPNLLKLSSLWDTCSGQVIVEEAGGRLTDGRGQRIDYRQQGKTNLEYGIAVSNGTKHDQLVALMAKHL